MAINHITNTCWAEVTMGYLCREHKWESGEPHVAAAQENAGESSQGRVWGYRSRITALRRLKKESMAAASLDYKGAPALRNQASNTHSHTNVLIYTHTQSYTYTHTHTHILNHTHSYTHILIYTHHTHTISHTFIHIYTHTVSHIHKHIHILTY